MSKLLSSKRGKAPSFFVTVAIVSAVLAIWLFVAGTDVFRLDGTSEFVMKIAPFVLIAVSFFFGFTAYLYKKTWIKIYDDGVEGFGSFSMGGFGMQSFRFDSRTKYTVTSERSYACVNANGVRYYVSLSHEDLNDIKRAVVHKKASSDLEEALSKEALSEKRAASSARLTSVKCSFCGEKCKLPKGKGRITVSCPHCGETFTANT